MVCVLIGVVPMVWGVVEAEAGRFDDAEEDGADADADVAEEDDDDEDEAMSGMVMGLFTTPLVGLTLVAVDDDATALVMGVFMVPYPPVEVVDVGIGTDGTRVCEEDGLPTPPLTPVPALPVPDE